MDNPSKITEGGVEYSLGKFDGKSVLYDFPKILIYLNVKGKLLFGEKFKIYDEDRNILLKLCSYFIKDEENCKSYDIDMNKGIFTFRTCRLWKDQFNETFKTHCANAASL